MATAPNWGSLLSGVHRRGLAQGAVWDSRPGRHRGGRDDPARQAGGIRRSGPGPIDGASTGG